MSDKKENLFLTKNKIYLGFGIGAYILSAASLASALVVRSSDNQVFSQINSDRTNQTLITTKQSIFHKYGKTSEFDLIAKTQANLLRKWAET